MIHLGAKFSIHIQSNCQTLVERLYNCPLCVRKFGLLHTGLPVLQELSLYRKWEISCDTSSMWTLKRNDTNELIYKTDSHRNELRFTSWEGIVREFGIDMCILLYFKWITNKDRLYNTWNSAQC